ncbi:MAG TPA: hypothetical protein VGJ26_06945 [Pirellulales bacterium]|jgi:hypothetical protein
MAALLSAGLTEMVATACPFCTAVSPSISQRREEATVAALGEVAGVNERQLKLRLHKVLSGAENLADQTSLTIPLADATGAAGLKAGRLALVLGTRRAADEGFDWEVTPLDEVSYGYVARAPARRLPPAERLVYYARFLEHANPLLAEDAYLEFGAASYDEVAQVADQLPMAKIRAWVADPRVPEARKGFYGLALGLARNEADRQANTAALERWIATPADDFRAGFDGALGGYLVLTGPAGLKKIDERYLRNPAASPGDVRHALTALRFFHEFGRGAIPAADLNKSLRGVLARPEFAPTVIVDLARWNDWEAMDDVTALFGREGYPDPATPRAVVGYLLASPEPQAARALAALRQRDPGRVADAEKQSTLFGPSR